MIFSLKSLMCASCMHRALSHAPRCTFPHSNALRNKKIALFLLFFVPLVTLITAVGNSVGFITSDAILAVFPLDLEV